jgi:hypothetical protein
MRVNAPSRTGRQGLISSTITMMTKITGIRRFRVEHLGVSPSTITQPEARHDRARESSPSRRSRHGEHDDDHVGAHLRIDLVDRGGHHAGERGERDAESVGQA